MPRKRSPEETRLALLLDASDSDLESIIAQAKTIRRYRAATLASLTPAKPRRRTRVRKAASAEVPTE